MIKLEDLRSLKLFLLFCCEGTGVSSISNLLEPRTHNNIKSKRNINFIINMPINDLLNL